ncbi:MAG: STN and carboxypeptidase regulatory-like domain-containing protein [Odoribacter splanchnicus]
MYRDANLETFARRDVNFQQATLDRVMEDCLKGTGLEYAVNGQTIVIRKQRPESPGQEMRKVKGLPMNRECHSRGDDYDQRNYSGDSYRCGGKYQLDVGFGKCMTLAFSFVGMKPQEVTVGNAAVVDVKLESDFRDPGRCRGHRIFQQIEDSLRSGDSG